MVGKTCVLLADTNLARRERLSRVLRQAGYSESIFRFEDVGRGSVYPEECIGMFHWNDLERWIRENKGEDDVLLPRYMVLYSGGGFNRETMDAVKRVISNLGPEENRKVSTLVLEHIPVTESDVPRVEEIKEILAKVREIDSGQVVSWNDSSSPTDFEMYRAALAILCQVFLVILVADSGEWREKEVVRSALEAIGWPECWGGADGYVASLKNGRLGEAVLQAEWWSKVLGPVDTWAAKLGVRGIEEGQRAEFDDRLRAVTTRIEKGRPPRLEDVAGLYCVLHGVG